MAELTEYEKKQVANILAWQHEPPSVISQGVGAALAPIAWLVSKVIPASAIESLLHAADWMADATISSEVPRAPEDATLEQLDEEADSVQNWAIGYAAVEGGVAGVVGLFALPADIPALIALSLRTIRRIGLCYGYDGQGEEEKQFVLGILSAAGANTIEEKVAAVAALQALQTTLLKKTWKAIAGSKIGRDIAIMMVKDVAKQLGINLTKRKALAAIPVIGAIIGGSLNAWYLRDIGLAAQRRYQERWLLDQGRVLDLSAVPVGED